MELDLEDLKESNEFLNLLLDNINTAVLIADENIQIHLEQLLFVLQFDFLILDLGDILNDHEEHFPALKSNPAGTELQVLL